MNKLDEGNILKELKELKEELKDFRKENTSAHTENVRKFEEIKGDIKLTNEKLDNHIRQSKEDLEEYKRQSAERWERWIHEDQRRWQVQAAENRKIWGWIKWGLGGMGAAVGVLGIALAALFGGGGSGTGIKN